MMMNMVVVVVNIVVAVEYVVCLANESISIDGNPIRSRAHYMMNIFSPSMCACLAGCLTLAAGTQGYAYIRTLAAAQKCRCAVSFICGRALSRSERVSNSAYCALLAS